MDVFGILQPLRPVLAPDVLALVEDFAAVGTVELDDGAAQGGFSAAGFSHQPQGLPLVDGQGHVVHRVEDALVLELEIFAHVFQSDDRLRHREPPFALGWWSQQAA